MGIFGYGLEYSNGFLKRIENEKYSNLEKIECLEY